MFDYSQFEFQFTKKKLIDSTEFHYILDNFNE